MAGSATDQVPSAATETNCWLEFVVEGSATEDVVQESLTLTVDAAGDGVASPETSSPLAIGASLLVVTLNGMKRPTRSRLCDEVNQPCDAVTP